MEHEVRREAGGRVVSLSGDIDLQQSPKAREVLLAAVGQGDPVVVDLSGVDYIDSSGVASLVEAFQLAKRGGVAFSLAAVHPSALRVLQLARLDRVFTIHEQVADGL